jgi:hypothetical protein
VASTPKWKVCGGSIVVTLDKNKIGSSFCPFLAILRHIVFVDGFILVKELGLLTNMVQWIRYFYAARSYMYILL